MIQNSSPVAKVFAFRQTQVRRLGIQAATIVVSPPPSFHGDRTMIREMQPRIAQIFPSRLAPVCCQPRIQGIADGAPCERMAFSRAWRRA